MRKQKKSQKPRTKILKTLQEADTTQIIPIAVTYKKPEDYPDKYVVRILDGKTGNLIDLAILRNTLEECREDIKASGYYACLARYDDPIIVESWL